MMSGNLSSLHRPPLNYFILKLGSTEPKQDCLSVSCPEGEIHLLGAITARPDTESFSGMSGNELPVPSRTSRRGLTKNLSTSVPQGGEALERTH